MLYKWKYFPPLFSFVFHRRIIVKVNFVVSTGCTISTGVSRTNNRKHYCGRQATRCPFKPWLQHVKRVSIVGVLFVQHFIRIQPVAEPNHEHVVGRGVEEFISRVKSGYPDGVAFWGPCDHTVKKVEPGRYSQRSTVLERSCLKLKSVSEINTGFPSSLTSAKNRLWRPGSLEDENG